MSELITVPTPFGPRKLLPLDRISPPDPRDYRFVPSVAQLDPTAHYDLCGAGLMPPIRDQGQEGCHDENTEVLTEAGWVAWPDYDGQAALGTVHPATQALEFQRPVALQAYRYDGPLYYANHRSLDFALTPNHRMFMRRWNGHERTLADDYGFTAIDKIGWYSGFLAAPTSWQGTTLERLGINGSSYDGDDFIALVALVVSDGWVGGTDSHKNTVSFCCFREDRHDVVASLARRLGFHEQPNRRGVWARNDGILANWFRQNAYSDSGLGSTNKRVPALIKVASEAQIRHFFDFFGDQSHTDRTDNIGRQMYSSSRVLIDDLQEILLRVGRRTSINERAPRQTTFSDGRVISAENAAPAYVLTVRQHDNLSLQRKRELVTDEYHGNVFCATVPNSTLITRRNGQVLISGNSCAGHASSEYLGHLYRRAQNGAPSDPIFSPAFAYYEARLRENWQNQDSGAYLRDEWDALLKAGCCREADMPYVAGQFAIPPSAQALADALAFKIDSYASVAFTDLDAALAQNVATAIGSYWYNEWFAGGDPQYHILPDPTSQAAGAHAWLICGAQTSLNVNTGRVERLYRHHGSWGLGYGDSTGHVWFPAHVLQRAAYEYWTAQKTFVVQPLHNTLTLSAQAQGTAAGLLTPQIVPPSPPSPPTPPSPPPPTPPVPNPDSLLSDVEQEFINFAALLARGGSDIRKLLNL